MNPPKHRMLLRFFLVAALVCGSVQLSQAQTTHDPSGTAQAFPGYGYLEALGFGWLINYFSEPQAQSAAKGTCPPCGVDPEY